MPLGDALTKLLDGPYAGLTISFNDEHACNYNVAADWDDYRADNEDSRIDWVSEEERRKAVATNSVWIIQWYPSTPVGFYAVGASTLEAAIAHVLKESS